MRSSIVVGLCLFHRRSALDLLLGGAVMEAGVGELHEHGGGAEVKMLRQIIVPLFSAAQAATVGVYADRPLVHGAALR